VGSAYKGVTLKDSVIKHYDHERDPVRQSQKKTYYRKTLAPRENKYQEVL